MSDVSRCSGEREWDVGMVARSQWTVKTKLIMTGMQHRATEAETPVLGLARAENWGVQELSFSDWLCNVQFRTLLYCAVHCVTPPSAVLILSYNIFIILASSDKFDSELIRLSFKVQVHIFIIIKSSPMQHLWCFNICIWSLIELSNFMLLRMRRQLGKMASNHSLQWSGCNKIFWIFEIPLYGKTSQMGCKF